MFFLRISEAPSEQSLDLSSRMMKQSSGKTSGKSSNCKEIETERPDFWREDMPRLVNILRRSRLAGAEGGKTRNRTLREIAEQMEPAYDTFYCPITKKIMEDPVTISSGVTYEKRAIANWFEANGSICPVTRKELENCETGGNAALKVTISEWRRRSEDLRIKLACVAIALASSNSMVLEATKDLQKLCKRRRRNARLARELGAMRLLGQFLELEGSGMRLEALRALTVLVGDEEGKDKIVGTKKVEMAARILSSEDPSEQDAAVSFLLELSKSEAICRRIGLVPGAILMLITVKFNRSCEDSVTAKIDKVLENLETFPGNIRLMAQDGHIEPLLRNLLGGSEETRLEMVNLLGNTTLPHDSKELVANLATSVLLDMARLSDPEARTSSLKALLQLSSHPSNASKLVQFGAVPLMMESMFPTSSVLGSSNSSMHLHSTIVADILEHVSYEPESLEIDSQGHTMTSHYAIYNLTHMLSSKSPYELSLNVLRILLSLASSSSKKPADRIAKAMREADLITTVIGFTCSPDERLAIAATKLLINLIPHLGSIISQKLREDPGQLGTILASLGSPSRVTERHAVTAELLARLPTDDIPLDKALLRSGAITLVLNHSRELQSNGRAVVSRQAKLYLEALVGILFRFTSTYHDVEIRNILIEKGVGVVLNGLLTSASEEIIALSALGLRNLSMATLDLSKPANPNEDKKKVGLFSSCFGRSPTENTRKVAMCNVHRGVCSAKTFCLVEMGAVGRLLGCMEHESDAVVDAAMSAVCTLMEGQVDVQEGVRAVAGGVGAVAGVMRGKGRGEGVRKKAMWVMERFIVEGYAGLVEEAVGERALSTVLVGGMRSADGEVKLMCENMLRCMKRLPNSSRPDRLLEFVWLQDWARLDRFTHLNSKL